jgi:hypothetical protein
LRGVDGTTPKAAPEAPFAPFTRVMTPCPREIAISEERQMRAEAKRIVKLKTTEGGRS